MKSNEGLRSGSNEQPPSVVSRAIYNRYYILLPLSASLSAIFCGFTYTLNHVSILRNGLTIDLVECIGISVCSVTLYYIVDARSNSSTIEAP